jgi:hypothetical protein
LVSVTPLPYQQGCRALSSVADFSSKPVPSIQILKVPRTKHTALLDVLVQWLGYENRAAAAKVLVANPSMLGTSIHRVEMNLQTLLNQHGDKAVVRRMVEYNAAIIRSDAAAMPVRARGG